MKALVRLGTALVAFTSMVVGSAQAQAQAQAQEQTSGPCDETTALQREVCQRAAASERLSRLAENGAVEATPWRPGVDLIAGRDASRAKLTLAPSDGSKKWIASITTPLKKGDPATEFLTLDGLAEDVELAVSRKATVFVLDRLDEIDFVARAKRREGICRGHGLPETCTAADLERELLAKDRSRGEVADALADFELMDRIEGRALPLLRVLPVHRWEIGASVGRTKRSFFSSGGEVRDEDRPSFSVGGSYGRLLGSALWKVDARWQRKFQAQQVATRCTPLDDNDAELERCQDLPLGQADRRDRLPITLEMRRSSVFRDVRWGVSPQLIHEFEDGTWAASLPVYLVPDADDNLTGGLSIDWREGQDPVVSVFVSAPLSFF